MTEPPIRPTSAAARGAIAIRRIGLPDVRDALRLGLADFLAQPSHYVVGPE